MKLIDLLVKELPQRGGWPASALSIAQDVDGQCWAYECTQLKFSSQTNLWSSRSGVDICRGFEIKPEEMADDWNKAFVTKSQYESALAASEGWIEWGGGECPVEEGTLVDVRFRNGADDRNIEANHLRWSHKNLTADIIAYRLQKPTESEQVRSDAWCSCAGTAETDDETDLNECIGQDVVTEWDGEGLPPVGIKCEHCPGGTTQHEWEVVTVAGVHKNTSTGFTDYWLVRENGSSYIVGNPYRFRPLRTEAEKAREKLAASLHIAAGASPIELNGIGSLYFKLADAIISGSIFGTTFKAGK